MPTSTAEVTSDVAVEPQSPELVLVAGTMAREARELLALPEDTLVRIERAIWTKRVAAMHEANAAAARERPNARASKPSSSRARTRLIPAAAIGATASLVVLFGVNVNFRGSPAEAVWSEQIPDVPLVSAPQAPETPGPPDMAAPPAGGVRDSTSSRRFAWAPVAGASGYHVEFFKGTTRIYAADVRRPQISLPTMWRHAGKPYRLVAGRYRWYVWPIASGLRLPQATVQAELAVR